MLSNGIKAALNWINFDSVMSDLTKTFDFISCTLGMISIYFKYFVMISGSFFCADPIT